jgi:hypothetical protein
MCCFSRRSDSSAWDNDYAPRPTKLQPSTASSRWQASLAENNEPKSISQNQRGTYVQNAVVSTTTRTTDQTQPIKLQTPSSSFNNIPKLISERSARSPGKLQPKRSHGIDANIKPDQSDDPGNQVMRIASTQSNNKKPFQPYGSHRSNHQHPNPPLCITCSSPLIHYITNAANENGNAGRPHWQCPWCRGFSYFDDSRGIHADNPRCKCGLLSRLMLAGREERVRNKRCLYYSCAQKRCGFWGLYRDERDEPRVLREDEIEGFVRNGVI